MPTYDYLCENCSHEFEKFQSITAGPLRKCPKCGKMKLQRLIGSGAGVIFKGSGFYQTDYRSDSYKKARDAEKPKTKESKDKKSETKTETKKTETKTKDSAKPSPKKSN
jgi:putative FmdB family regulatory protein